MSKENIKDTIIIIVLVIACFIVLTVEYFLLMRPLSAQKVFLTPTNISELATLSTVEEILIGTYFDDYAPSLKFTMILKKINGVYYKTEIFNDGSQGTFKLNVKIVNGQERLIEEGDDGYFGDYMVIESNRDVVFYDKKGFIYRLHPK